MRNIQPHKAYVGSRNWFLAKYLDYKLILNTDDKIFGGIGLVDTTVVYAKQNCPYASQQQSVQIYIPARGAQVLAPQ